MSSEQNNTANADSDPNTFESHREERNSSSQAEMNHKINKLPTEMNEIRTLVATLTQQVILNQRKERLREPLTNSRNQERVDMKYSLLLGKWYCPKTKPPKLRKVCFETIIHYSSVQLRCTISTLVHIGCKFCDS